MGLSQGGHCYEILTGLLYVILTGTEKTGRLVVKTLGP